MHRVYVLHACGIYIYKVAQNKMSHQAQYNLSTTSGDFSIKFLGFKGEDFQLRKTIKVQIFLYVQKVFKRL